VNQNILRERLKEYLEISGVKQTFLSQKIGLNKRSLSVFKCGAYDLSEEKAVLLNDIIEKGIKSYDE
jgi:hypothetical protein